MHTGFAFRYLDIFGQGCFAVAAGIQGIALLNGLTPRARMKHSAIFKVFQNS